MLLWVLLWVLAWLWEELTLTCAGLETHTQAGPRTQSHSHGRLGTGCHGGHHRTGQQAASLGAGGSPEVLGVLSDASCSLPFPHTPPARWGMSVSKRAQSFPASEEGGHPAQPAAPCLPALPSRAALVGMGGSFSPRPQSFPKESGTWALGSEPPSPYLLLCLPQGGTQRRLVRSVHAHTRTLTLALCHCPDPSETALQAGALLSGGRRLACDLIKGEAGRRG